MQFSTASKKSNQESTTGVFVALYLILLAFFILLTKDLSFDVHKKTVAMRSIGETFGRPKEQAIVFGRLTNVKISDYAMQLEAITKGYGKVTIDNSEEKLKVTIPLDAIYFSDESNFRSAKLDDMMQISGIIKKWADAEPVEISVNLSETEINRDEKRLNFFNKRYGAIALVGLKIDAKKELEINVEKKL